MKNVYIVDGARTAFTAFGGSLATTDAVQLGTKTAVEALKRANVQPEQVEHVIYGGVITTGANSAYLARHIGLYLWRAKGSAGINIKSSMRIRYAIGRIGCTDDSAR